jgi:hypothetical protein
MLFGESLIFQRNISPPSSGSNGKSSKEPAEAGGNLLSLLSVSAGFLIGFSFDLEDGGDVSYETSHFF